MRGRLELAAQFLAAWLANANCPVLQRRPSDGEKDDACRAALDWADRLIKAEKANGS